jgi:hypothetical protein
MSGPMYTYTPNTPNPADPMNGTAPLIRGNFQAINELVNVNHVGFNTANLGMHNFISMPFPSSATTPASTDINMYTASTPSGPNLAEIFFENSSGIQSQISAVQSGGGTPTGTSGTGWCQFATSGMIMKWGTATLTTTGTYTYPPGSYPAGTGAVFNFPTGGGIPPFVYGVAYVKATPIVIPQSTMNYGSFGVYYRPPAKTQFQIILASPPTTISFNWFAIGQ